MRFITRVIAGLLLLASFPALAAQLDVTFSHTTTYADTARTPLPATGQGALTSTRVEVGTCNGDQFGTVLAGKVVPMPGNKASFDIPFQVVCLRAFPSNTFGEGKPYPLAVNGPPPSDGGSITVIRWGSP